MIQMEVKAANDIHLVEGKDATPQTTSHRGELSSLNIDGAEVEKTTESILWAHN